MYLITGSTGFVGRHLVERLKKESIPFRTLARGERPHVTGQWTLLHLAWDVSKRGDNAAQEESLSSFQDLVRHGDGLKRIVFFGSGAEFGNQEGTLKENASPGAVVSPYGVTKAKARRFLEDWSGSGGRSAVVLRPFVIFGPGQKGPMLIPQAMEAYLANRSLDVSDGSQVRDFLYIDDLIEGIVSVIQNDRLSTFVDMNLGSGSPVQVREMMLEMERLFKPKSVLRIGAIAKRNDEPVLQIPDLENARKLIGWAPKVNWREGLERTFHHWTK